MEHDRITPYQETCVVETPDRLINRAFQFAKENIARCNAALHAWLGHEQRSASALDRRGAGYRWMCLGTDYVAPWFAPKALRVFRDRQLANGQILEYVCLETGKSSTYGLNASDNTPLFLWAVHHHWRHHAGETFRTEFGDCVRRAADYLVAQMQDNGLIEVIPDRSTEWGRIASWRNIPSTGFTICGAYPPLSSIRLNGQKIGRLAAEMLHEMMLGRDTGEVTMQVPADTLIVRRSTDIVAVQDPALAAALRFIREHAVDPIGVDDVCRATAQSRRVLEQRFRRRLRRSVHEEIRRVQLEHARTLLQDSGRTLDAIAQECGLKRGVYLSSVFRKATGMTPGQYRRLRDRD